MIDILISFIKAIFVGHVAGVIFGLSVLALLLLIGGGGKDE